MDNKDLKNDEMLTGSEDSTTGYKTGRKPKTKGNSPRFSFNKKSALGKAPSSADLPHNSVKWGVDKTWAPVDKFSIERDGYAPQFTPGNGEYNRILAGQSFHNLIPNNNLVVTCSTDSTGKNTIVNTTPGCCVLYYMPTMGASSNMNSDPVNRATDMLYSYVVNTLFNNNPPYWSHCDVGMHVFKISNLIHMLDFARLIITAGCQRPDQNYNMPQCYYKAIRLTGDPDKDTYVDAYGAWKSIYDNRISLAQWFNRLVDSVNTIHLPDGMPIIRNHKMMLDAWYSDSQDVEHGQLYAFAPIGFWHYDENHPDPDKPNTWSGSLTFDRIYTWRTNHMWKIEDLLQKIEDWVNEYKFKSTIQWEVGNAIYNAYGSENMYIYGDFISIAEITHPAVFYSEDVLQSIENAVIVNDVEMYTIQADPLRNKLIGRPQVKLYNPEGAVLSRRTQLFWNIPLRFKGGMKPDFASYSNALKFHPIASYVQVHDSDTTTPCIDFGACFGTDIITEAVCVWRNPSPGASVADGMKYGWEEHRITNRDADTDTLFITSDWDRFPVLIMAWDSKVNDNHVNNKLMQMSGNREMEVIMDEKCAQSYFKALTEYMWGSDITRSTKALFSESARKKIGI